MNEELKNILGRVDHTLLSQTASWAEIKTICDCGAKATVNARIDGDGHIITQGAQVVLGANDKYIGLCRRHWVAGDLGPDFKPLKG